LSSATTNTCTHPSLPHNGNHAPTSSAEVTERIELYFYPYSGPSRHVIGENVPFMILTPTFLLNLSLSQIVSAQILGRNEKIEENIKILEDIDKLLFYFTVNFQPRYYSRFSGGYFKCKAKCVGII
jgi:hypothetical protein